MLICGPRAEAVDAVVDDEDDETKEVDMAVDVAGDDGALRDIIADGVAQVDAGRDGNIASICDGNDDVRVTVARSAPSLLAARGRLEPATLRTPVLGAALEERRFDFLPGAAGAAGATVDVGDVSPDDEADEGDTTAGDDEDDDDELLDRGCLRRFFCFRARATVEPENDGTARAFANVGEALLALAAAAAPDAIEVAAEDLFDDEDEREAEVYGCEG